MGYRRSEPLQRWLGPRRETIDVLAVGHAQVGGLTRPGRPLDASKPLAHAYVIVAVSQFQGFVRDLHDLSVQRLVSASGAAPPYVPLMIEAVISGRSIDRGNPTHTSIKNDFGRIGLTPFDLTSVNPRWNQGDARTFQRLIELRNALGHGNEYERRKLIATGDVQDTVSWARGRLPVLNRYAKGLDRLVWDHVRATTGKDPW